VKEGRGTQFNLLDQKQGQGCPVVDDSGRRQFGQQRLEMPARQGIRDHERVERDSEKDLVFGNIRGGINTSTSLIVYAGEEGEPLDDRLFFFLVLVAYRSIRKKQR